MTQFGGAAFEKRRSTPFAASATGVFRHLGEASQRLMELQAQAAAIVLMDSAARYADVMEGALRNFGMPQLLEVQRSQMQAALGPLQAWLEAATGLQAVLAAGFLQAVARTAFAGVAVQPAADDSDDFPERRFNSVVIQFPDRRRPPAAL